MGMLDWVKGRGKPGRATESPKNDSANPEISAFWLPAPYTDRASGYRARPCVGWSENGYHAGLTVAPPDGEAVTTWGEPFKEKGHALVAANSAFAKWIERHEAQREDVERLGKASNPPRKGATWER
jgi:hypothetical protein